MAGPIVFIDMRDRDVEARHKLETSKAELQQRKTEKGSLPPDQDQRLTNINDVLDRATRKQQDDKVLDPTFRRLRTKLNDLCGTNVDEHQEGKLPTQRVVAINPNLTSEEERLAAVYGILGLDNIKNDFDERLFTGLKVAPPASIASFDGSIPKALGEFTTHHALFHAVLHVLVEDGDITQGLQLRAYQWAAVVRSLREDNVGANDPLLPLKVRVSLAKVEGASDGAPTSTINIDLPDLEEQAELEIIAETSMPCRPSTMHPCSKR